MEITKDVLNRLPILTILEDHNIKLVGSGDSLKGISPFRATSNLNSFTVSVSRNICHDWKLDYVAGPVKFIMKLFGLSEEDAMGYLCKKYFEGESPVLELAEPVKKEMIEPLNLDVLDKAYRIFLSFCSLTEEDRQYLKTVRSLSDEEIELFGFKSFPRRTIRHELQETLIKEGIIPTDIPGFFQYSDDEYITFSYYVGILIPIKDMLGRIVGLQVRKRKLKDLKDNRYVWLSSAFAVNKKNEHKFAVNGRSPESPIGFIESTFKDATVTTLFVTEGFFKSLAIRKKLRSPSLTVQGVTNWKGLKDIVLFLKTNRYPKLNRIIFALDADFISNMNVSKQLCKMFNVINADWLKCFSMQWDLSIGKGIDDFLEADSKFIEHMYLMPMEDFQDAFTEFEPIGKELLEKEASDEEFALAYGAVLKGKKKEKD